MPRQVKAPSPNPLARRCRDCDSGRFIPCKDEQGRFKENVCPYRKQVAKEGNLARPTRRR